MDESTKSLLLYLSVLSTVQLQYVVIYHKTFTLLFVNFPSILHSIII